MQPVTPYIWQYQPQTGETAGARQDYGAVVNWFSCSPLMCQRIAALNRRRNVIDKERAKWRTLDPVLSNSPSIALAGKGYALNDGRQYRKLRRDALPFPHGYQVFEDGAWKPVPIDMNGAGNALSSYPTVVTLQSYERSTDATLQGAGSVVSAANPPNAAAHPSVLLNEPPVKDRDTGMSPTQFAGRFPPVVYDRPFSEPQYYFPKEFNPLWEPAKDFRPSTAISMKYRTM